jgi:hypothetical protein
MPKTEDWNRTICLMTVLLKTGVLQMTVETYEAIQELAQSRRLLLQTMDPSTMDSLTNYIEQLEHRLLLEMRKRPPDLAAG